LPQSQTLAVERDFFRLFALRLDKGRLFADFDGNKPFVVLGAKVLKHQRKAGVIGKLLQIQGQYYTVIGVLKSADYHWLMPIQVNDGVFLSLSSSARVSPHVAIGDLLFRYKKNLSSSWVEKQFAKHIHQHYGKKIRFSWRRSDWLMEGLKAQKQTFFWLWSGVSFIALLIGGMGVMNVMLMAVILRRREIGLRMALGASSGEIQRMFIFEGILISMIAAFCGNILGVGIAALVSYFAGWSFIWFAEPIALAFLLAFILGVIFSMLPARKASRIEPIKALQSID
jgi:putative ABC transport system permease protein